MSTPSLKLQRVDHKGDFNCFCVLGVMCRRVEVSVDEVGEGPSMVSDSLPATFAAVCCIGERFNKQASSFVLCTG
jgi:hypothetical protein